MKNKPEHVIFVGNTNESHLQAMLAHADRFPDKDWMRAMNYSKQRFEGMANFIRMMSVYFKEEADKYGFSYYEISDEDFDNSIAEIVKKITTE